MSIEARLEELEGRVDRQDFLHRNVGEDGNIVHMWSWMPYASIGLIFGLFLGILICMNYKKIA